MHTKGTVLKFWLYNILHYPKVIYFLEIPKVPVWSVISYSTKALNHALPPIRLEWLQTHSLPTKAEDRIFSVLFLLLLTFLLLFHPSPPLLFLLSLFLFSIYSRHPYPHPTPSLHSQCWVDWELEDYLWFTFGLTPNFFVHMFFIAMIIILRAMTLLWRNVPGLRKTCWNSMPHDISMSASQYTPVD